MVSAPTPELLLIPANAVIEAPESLSKKDAQEDLRLLKYTFQRGYGGRKHLPLGSFDQLISKINQIDAKLVSDITTEKFCINIDEALREVPDHHLMVANNRRCGTTDKETPGTVGHNLNTRLDRPWNLTYRQIGRRKIPILSISALPSYEDAVWEGFLDQVKAIKASSAAALVIDLRGNGGGDDTTGQMLADALYGAVTPSPVQEIMKSETAETFALSAGNYFLKAIKLRNTGKPVPKHIQSRIDKWIGEFQRARLSHISEERSESPRQGEAYDSTKAFDRPIYLLIDRHCASSCESTLEYFEAFPKAITVGENTGGFIHVGNMGMLWLPHSHLVIQMATDYWKYRDNRYLEKIGYSPKLPCPGKDALAVALEDFQEK